MARRRLPAGLRERNGRWSYEVRHQKLRGDRMVLALRTDDLELALERRQAVRTLMDRGDWEVVDRLRRGEIHITDVQAAVRRGEVADLRRAGTSPTHLGEAVAQFLQRTDATAGSDRTYHQYETACSVLLEHLGEAYPMEDLTVEEAEGFLHAPKARASGDTWAARTQVGKRTTYIGLWDLAIERDREAAELAGLEPRLTRNPWRQTKVKEIRPTRLEFLRPEEWWDLVKVVRGRPHLALLTFAYRAGLRSGEIRHLRTDVDVVLDGDKPLVRVQSRSGEHAWTPKTRRSERAVPLTPDAVELLTDHVERGYAGDRYFVRPTHSDKPMHSSSAERWTREAYEAAGIRYGREKEALTLHSGRHTYASWMAQEGVPLNVVADLLGNTLKETAETYAHLVPDTYRASAMLAYRKLMEARK